MSEKSKIEELLTHVGEESEARRHDSLPDDAVGIRRSGESAPRVLSVRLTGEQYERLVR